MKNLKEYIVEGIFDIEDNIDNVDKIIKDQIKQFLKENFKGASSCKISRKPNTDGKYEVSSSKNIEVKNNKVTSLTNGMFIWTKVGGSFDCYGRKSLISLEGAPKEVDGDFKCGRCSLTSLEGAPEKVGGYFSCVSCDSLISLEGAPKEVGWNFYCYYCTSLTSLEGAPKEVGGKFVCYQCGAKFTMNDIKKISNVKGNIEV